MASIGTGVAAIGPGVGWLLDSDLLGGAALIGTGVALIGPGVGWLLDFEYGASVPAWR